MKHLLLLLALLLALPSRQASAQQAPLAASPSLPSPAPARPDSAAILHQLFLRNRRVGRLSPLMLPNLAFGLDALGDPRGLRRATGSITVGSSTGFLILGLSRWLRYSSKREQEAVAQLRQHRPLRPYVQRTYTSALVYAATQRR